MTARPTPDLPLVIVGAGPIGLAAAAHAYSRGLPTVLLEAGPQVGASVREWGHVRLFSAWRELVDPVAESLLRPRGWAGPDPDRYPVGAEWVADYLEPLAEALAATGVVEVRTGHRVVGVAKRGRDRLVDSGREDAPFTVHVEHDGVRSTLLAAAVVDASGTWTGPNPLGADGLPALGETEHAARITYGIPDFADEVVRARYGGKRVAVAGRGASAQNTLVGLAGLAAEVPSTSVVWLLRRPGVEDAFGGGDNDQLEARGALGKRAEQAVSAGPVEVVTGFRTERVAAQADGRLTLTDTDGRAVGDVDEVIVVTGFRPDLTWLSEVRLDLDPVLSAPRTLAPLIDPNVHSCGTVYPHGAAELAQPEPGLYLAGMKSYGRAPSFLALTGFEQTRSIVAAVAGDHEAAARVELVLPESGVCGGSGVFDGEPTEANGGACCAPAQPELITIGAPATGGSGCG
ncbi:NAD(P)-binding domain-containing protein [Nocardioides sp.]|uniref:NAD(P)-binding domain-containing protein n=1 Tax=Nocardioides sp. TaxID=35761 RepID=UPI001A1856C3|nr:NAD(P)-binding domain-containing protein [Nocardioides sp.]MBJ7358083.1 NAD(P)-binding domain-containing protein [Nocardioides sp.]